MAEKRVGAIDSDGFAHQLQALLPTGAAWPRQDGATLTAIIRAMADGLARCDFRARALLDEFDPRTASELLTDWETELGLPDSCAGQAETIKGRRDAIITKLTSIGDQSPVYFIKVAELLGYSIIIEEHDQFRFGRNRFGDRFVGGGWQHTWTVHAPSVTEVRFRFGVGRFGERLLNFGNKSLECAIHRYKPAHTHVIFSYGD